MKARTTLRIKLIWALMASVGLAVVCMLVLCVFMILASTYMPFAIFFSKHLLGFILLFLAIFSMLTIMFFFLMIQRKVQYIEEITHSLDKVSGGYLDILIPIRTTDELGVMAGTVNEMAVRLKSSLEERDSQERVKNNLITNISHDLRTPLTSILGYLELIGGKAYEDEAQLRHYSEIALKQCKELKSRIDMLFEYTKVSSPDIKLSKVRVDLSEMIGQVMMAYLPVLNEAGMEYRLVMPNGKIQAEADPLLLSRVMDNLVGNAIKYGRTGKYLDVELALSENKAVIRFINYGKTIPQEDLPHVFERYYRAEHGASAAEAGTGLGLAIARSIMELHQGSITVESKEGRTVFEIRLKAH